MFFFDKIILTKHFDFPLVHKNQMMEQVSFGLGLPPSIKVPFGYVSSQGIDGSSGLLQ